MERRLSAHPSFTIEGTGSWGKMGDDSLDLAPLVAGIVTILRQHDASTLRAYVDHLASEHSAYTGYTPLYLAVESGADGKIAKLLLDRGANVNTPVSVHRRRPS